MGRIATLVPMAYGPSITKIDDDDIDVMKPVPGKPGEAGPVTTNPIVGQLAAGVAVQVLPANANRVGLLVQNLDTTAALNYAFGLVAGPQSKFLPAGGVLLLDFVTPTDTLSLFSASSILFGVDEFQRTPAFKG
jgi:hypothetical protein